MRTSEAMLESLLGREKKAGQTGVAPESKEGRPTLDESDKQRALLEADRVASDELAATEFILRCGFADARLRAAEHIHSAPLLERVLESTRKLDRRVAKLMQHRLDAIAKRALIAKHADECLETAQRLLQERPIVPNRVAEMDRAWRSIGEISEPHQSRFEAVRAQIEARLTAQASLQRSTIDALEKLRGLNRSLGSFSADQAIAFLDELDQVWSMCRQSAEFSSLPKTLMTDFEDEYHRFKDGLASKKSQDESPSRAQRLAFWEAADPTILNVQELKAEWSRLPAADDGESSSLQQRFQALIERLTSQAEASGTAKQNETLIAAFSEALQSMEQAIQAGALHVAIEKDDALRKLEKQLQRLNHAQLTRLNHARASLKQLQAWARWSGNISREELIKAVEDLSSSKMRFPELAKAVTDARARWKALDVQSGVAPKALWERFDSACRGAYAPVAEHMKKQAQERQQNKEKAEALIADMRQFYATSGLNRSDDLEPAPDWKRIASFYQKIEQSWLRMGHMDRKDQKRLHTAYEAERNLLFLPLSQQWDAEIKKRETLIAEVEAFSASDRNAMEKIRSIQQRWQQCAKAIPLAYKTEQALWQRFRIACDVVFSQRKAATLAADAERKQNTERKITLCATLEAATHASESVIRDLLRETDAAWKKIGPVWRDKEQRIDVRYRKAISTLHARLKAASDAARQAQTQGFFEKLALCRTLEAAVVAGEPWDDNWRLRWEGLPSLSISRENLIRQRFDSGRAALLTKDEAYAKRLVSNRSVLQKMVLRAEVMAGVSSPPAFSQERLQVQVEVLQASFSGGKGEKSLTALMEELCATPGLADEETVARMERLFKKIWREPIS